MNRRDLLKRAGAAIIPAAILGSRLPAIDILRQPRTSRIAAVVYDERYSDCRSFAELLGRHGAIPFPVNGDCVRLWHGALTHHLVRNRGSVAGLTTDSDFVVSRACAREIGLSAAYEGAHDSRGSNYITHRFQNSSCQYEVPAPLANDGASWAEFFEQSLLRESSRGGSAIFHAPVSLKTRRSSDHPGYLTSWLLQQRA